MKLLDKLFPKKQVAAPSKKVKRYDYKLQVELVLYDKQKERYKIPLVEQLSLSQSQEAEGKESLDRYIRMNLKFLIDNNEAFEYKQDKKTIVLLRDNIAGYEYEYQILEKTVRDVEVPENTFYLG